MEICLNNLLPNKAVCVVHKNMPQADVWLMLPSGLWLWCCSVTFEPFCAGSDTETDNGCWQDLKIKGMERTPLIRILFAELVGLCRAGPPKAHSSMSALWTEICPFHPSRVSCGCLCGTSFPRDWHPVIWHHGQRLFYLPLHRIMLFLAPARQHRVYPEGVLGKGLWVTYVSR